MDLHQGSTGTTSSFHGSVSLFDPPRHSRLEKIVFAGTPYRQTDYNQPVNVTPPTSGHAFRMVVVAVLLVVGFIGAVGGISVVPYAHMQAASHSAAIPMRAWVALLKQPPQVGTPSEPRLGRMSSTDYYLKPEKVAHQ